jgi:hypothetical protein
MKMRKAKLCLAALGIVAVLLTPAFAQKPQRQAAHPATTQFQVPSGDDVIVDGRYRGADPDPQIRNELAREDGDWSAAAGGGY